MDDLQHIVQQLTGPAHKGDALLILVLDCALELSGRQPVRRAASALGFSLLCGGFWELVTPLYLARSTGDWRDVAAVCLGGLTMHAILKRTK